MCLSYNTLVTRYHFPICLNFASNKIESNFCDLHLILFCFYKCRSKYKLFPCENKRNVRSKVSTGVIIKIRDLVTKCSVLL
jgi:hypothetical protein